MRLYAHISRVGIAALLWLAVVVPAGANGALDVEATLAERGADAGAQFTPTYIVYGTVYPGSYSIDEFAEIIDPLVADN